MGWGSGAAAPGVLRGFGAAGRGCTALLWPRRTASPPAGTQERRRAFGGLAGPWRPGDRLSLGSHGLAAQRAPTPAMTSSWARTRSAAVRRVGSAARATYCWLIIHIYILDFHSTFLVVLFRSVFSVSSLSHQTTVISEQTRKRLMYLKTQILVNNDIIKRSHFH